MFVGKPFNRYIACFCLLTASASVAAAPSGALTVAVGAPFVPFAFTQKGQLVGFDIDIWKAVAATSGVSYVFEVVPFENILAAVQAGKADVGLAAFSITAERQKSVDFSDPYYLNGWAALVPTEAPAVTAPRDFANKWVGVKSGGTAAQVLGTRGAEARIKRFPNIDSAYLALATQGLDAVVHDLFAVQYYAQTEARGRSKVGAVLTQDDPYGMAFPKGSAWVARTNRALQALKASGQYDMIYARWFGSPPPQITH